MSPIDTTSTRRDLIIFRPDPSTRVAHEMSFSFCLNLCARPLMRDRELRLTRVNVSQRESTLRASEQDSDRKYLERLAIFILRFSIATLPRPLRYVLPRPMIRRDKFARQVCKPVANGLFDCSSIRHICHLQRSILLSFAENSQFSFRV
jgi:hypothetical protein